jgi:hypothetical protein
MFGFARYLLGKIANYWDVISAVSSWLWTITGGVMTAWATRAAGVFSQFAPFSWVVAGLLGALIAALSGLLIAYLRYLLIKAKAYSDWSKKDTEGVNPIDLEFHKRRIHITDIANPFSRIISGKRFIDCELMGPCNIVLGPNIKLMGISFMDCDVVVTNASSVPLFNKIAIQLFKLRDSHLSGEFDLAHGGSPCMKAA